MGRELLSSNLDVRCQYAEAESRVSQAAAPIQQPETRTPVSAHPLSARVISTSAVGVTNSKYRHNPYGYIPIHTLGNQWPSAQSGAAPTQPNSTCGDEPCGLPSASALPAYDEVGFSTAPYARDNTYAATYYSNAPNYGYDNAAYSYY